MINEEKLQKMIDLAAFEQIEGKEDLKIAGYYKWDYIGLGILGNFFQMTVGYGLILLLVLLYHLDFLMENFDQLNMQLLLILTVIGYICIMGIYTVIVIAIRSARYQKAVERVGRYEDILEELEDLYQKKN